MTMNNPRVLIVDDEERNRIVLKEILQRQGYTCSQAGDGVEALEEIKKDEPDVILLDIRMPRMDGLELIKRIKEHESWQRIPVVIVSGVDDMQARVQALKLGADDFLVKPPHIEELKARVRSLVKVKAYNDYMVRSQEQLKAEVAERTGQLQQAIRELKETHEKLKSSSLDTIYRLSRAAEYRDEDTASHIQRISQYAGAVARQLRMSEDDVEAVLYATPMHDVGKIGIPDKILLKPGRLDENEWNIMKKHTTFGASILEGASSSFLKLGREIALTHHERWDGSGYPNGLKGTDIPVAGRITALVDVFDALTSKRPYKPPFPVAQSFQIIREGRGSHFDPQVVDAFFAQKEQILKIREENQNGDASILFQLSMEADKARKRSPWAEARLSDDSGLR
jgi:putative two-component system response regulator